MDKFRISAFVITLIAILLSLYKTLTQNNSESANDYHPDTKDKNITSKIMWYFSQITYQSEFLILIYFGLRTFTKYKFDILFATIAPYCLTKNIHYFYLLYPKYAKKLNTNLSKLDYSNLSVHLIDTIFIILEAISITYKFSYLFFHLVYIIFAIFIILLNKFFRNTWSYKFLNLNNLDGWTYVYIYILTNQIFSFFLYFINKLYNNKNYINILLGK